MEVEQQELSGVEAILQECGEEITLTRGGYPCFRDVDTVAQSVSGTDMSAEFVIVTRGKDANRNGCMVQIVAGDGGDGLILDNFKTNPVVLLNHGEQFALPLGLSSLPKLEAKKATAKVTFSQVLPEAQQIFALLDEGLLKTASISYLPHKARMQTVKRSKKDAPQDEDVLDFRSQRCIDFISNDLLEWSIVTIPADPGAVRRFLELGNIRGEKLTRSVRQSLEPHAEAEQANVGWTKRFDEMMARIEQDKTATDDRIAKLEQQAIEKPLIPAPLIPSAKAAPESFGKIIADAIAAAVAPLNAQIEQSMQRLPQR